MTALHASLKSIWQVLDQHRHHQCFYVLGSDVVELNDGQFWWVWRKPDGTVCWLRDGLVLTTVPDTPSACFRLETNTDLVRGVVKGDPPTFVELAATNRSPQVWGILSGPMGGLTGVRQILPFTYEFGAWYVDGGPFLRWAKEVLLPKDPPPPPTALDKVLASELFEDRLGRLEQVGYGHSAADAFRDDRGALLDLLSEARDRLRAHGSDATFVETIGSVLHKAREE